MEMKRIPSLKKIPVYHWNGKEEVRGSLHPDMSVMCESDICPLRSECKWHTTAGDFRSEGGIDGEMVPFFGDWYCTMHPRDEHEEGRLIHTWGENWFEVLSKDIHAPPIWRTEKCTQKMSKRL